jgi:hypothetical protein
MRQCATPSSIKRAYEILHELSILSEKRGIPLPQPYTYGTPDDGIQFEWKYWKNKGREFHLEIIPTTDSLRYEYLLCENFSLDSGSEGDAGDLNESIADSPVIETLLSWVAQGFFTKED